MLKIFTPSNSKSIDQEEMPVFLKISETLLKIQEIERTKQCPAKVTTLFGGDKVYVRQKI